MNTTCSRLRYVHSSEYYITTRHIMYQNENLVVISKVSEQIDSTYSALQEGGKGSTAI